MKIFKILTILIAFSAFSCNQQLDKAAGGEGESEAAELPSTGNFGAEINAENAITVAEVIPLLEEADSVATKITGTVVAACQVSGCWMDLDLGNGETMKITFKDYGFFVPKDAAGKTAIVEGYAYRELIDVETLKHYAEDEGLSQEEIDAITEPEMQYIFVADGVIIL